MDYLTTAIMRKTFSALALAAFVIAGCTTEKESAPVKGAELTITASRDGATRTVIQADGTTVWWSAGEKIDVFYGPGTTPAVFTGQNDAPAATATFKGEIAVDSGSEKSFYAIYPSSPVSAIAANGEFSLTLEAVQPAVAGSFADGVFPAVAVSNSTTMSFHNVAGGIKFSVEEDNVSEVTIESNGGEPLAGNVNVAFVGGEPEVVYLDSGKSWVTVTAPEGGFVKGEYYYAALLPTSLSDGITITLKRGDAEPITIVSNKPQTVKRGVIGKVGGLSGPKSLEIETVWAMFSTAGAAWNEYFGGAANSDRNIAMDDEYVYVAETPVESGVDSKKLWAISISDHNDVRLVNTEGVSGGPKSLVCPRVIKNSDASINGGKDILVCSNLTRGGEEPKLYMWVNGIDNAPKVVTLMTWATGAWYGDTFTVSGSLQDGILFFDKTGGDANGVVTFNLAGLPGDNLYLLKRIKFNEALGSHSGVCAYYPFPGNDNAGVYSPGRGVESRGYSSTFTGDLRSEGNAAYAPTLTKLEYTEGRNGFVLGYNFIEWKDKRYVIYGKQESGAEGKVYVLEGGAGDDWLNIINYAPVKFRRDLIVEGNPRTSGASGMDVTARIINGDLYFAAQKQNVACGLYKLVYK